MRSNIWIQSSYILLLMFVVLGGANAVGQEKGKADLDKAFEAKLESKSTKDLDEVVKLCESAIEKGLDKEDLIEAKQLASSTLLEHANQLGRRIFSQQGKDSRWRIYRSQALKRLRDAVEYNPDLAEAYLMIAKLNGEPGGDEDEAIEALDKAIELAGDDKRQLSEALYLRANLNDDSDTKIDDLNQAIKINPNNIKAVRQRADYYLMRREPKQALDDLKKWLDSDPKNVENHLKVVRDLMRMGAKFDKELQGEALDIIDTAIELEPDLAMSHTFRAQLNKNNDKLDEAVKDASRAIKLDRKNLGAFMIRAEVYSQQGGEENLKAALEDVEEVLQSIPNHLDAIERRGIIYSQQNNLEYAIKDFKALAQRDPESLFYRNQLAVLYNANNEPTRAVQIYRNLLAEFTLDDLDEKPPMEQVFMIRRRISVLSGIGGARLSTGAHEKAIASYSEVLELEDQIREIEEAEEVDEPAKPDEGVRNNLAWVLATTPKEKLRDGKRAVKLATKAAELTDYDQAYILSTLAAAHAETGDFDKAVEWMEKALEVNKRKSKDGTAGTDGREGTKEQLESLTKELESYEKKEAWRELQNVEEDKDEDEDEDHDDDKEKDDDK